MAAAIAGPPGGFGLTVAVRLVQWHLGSDLALLGVRTLTQTNRDFREWLGAAPCEATLQTACAASGPAVMLATFAMIQAYGGVSDLLTKVGLLLASVPIVVDTLLVIVTPVLDEQMYAEVGVGGLNIREAGGGHSGRRWWGTFSALARVASMLAALGQGMLVFAAAPGKSTLLICASATLRTQLAVHALAALLASMKLHMQRLTWVCMYAAKATEISPALALIALLDVNVMGDEIGLMSTPELWCALTVAVQAGFAIFRGLAMKGPEEDPDEPQRAGSLPRLFGAVSALAVAAAVIPVLVRTINLKPSLTGVVIEWGEPVAAGASILLASYCGVYCMRLLALTAFEPEGQPTNAHTVNGAVMNGLVVPTDAEDDATEVQLNGSGTNHEVTREGTDVQGGLVNQMMAATSLLPGFVSAMVASRGSEPTDSESSMILETFATLRYGFVLLPTALALQVLVVILVAGQTDGRIEFDGMGIVGHLPSPKALGIMQLVAQLLLLVGLTLGLIGLGVLFWPACWVVGSLVLYPLMPYELREALLSLLVLSVAVLKLLAGVAATSVADKVQEHQKRSEQSKEKQAKEKADALLREASKGSEVKPVSKAKAKSAPKSGPQKKKR